MCTCLEKIQQKTKQQQQQQLEETDNPVILEICRNCTVSLVQVSIGARIHKLNTTHVIC